MKKSYGLFWQLLFIILTFLGCEYSQVPYDLIIQNGTVVDGTNTPAFKASLAIKKDKIVKISRHHFEVVLCKKLS